MTLSDYINDIKLELTGYTDETRLMTIPFSRCIDLEGSEVCRVIAVYRTYADGSSSDSQSSAVDPMYTQM